MKIKVNGQSKEVDSGIDLGKLLEQMQLDVDCVAVECNLEVLKRESFATTELNDGDNLEIVQFVGGG